MSGKIEVQNVGTPAQITRLDAAEYTAMKDAMLTGPADPRIAAKEMKAAALPPLPDELFPINATADWCENCVQLDLEAMGILQCHDTKSLSRSRA